MSRINERRYISWHETCACKCRLDANISNNKQRWNNEKCRCECKEMIDKGRYDNGFIWNPSICEWKNVEKKPTDKLAEEVSEDINGKNRIHNVPLNNYEKVCRTCRIYIVLLIMTFVIIIGISSAFFYFYWLKKKSISVNVFFIRLLYCNQIYVSEVIDINKSFKSKECMICHYWYFKDIGYKYEPYVSDGCDDISMMVYQLENIAILNVKGVDYR